MSRKYLRSKMIKFTKEQKQYLRNELNYLNNANVDRIIEYLPEIEEVKDDKMC